MLPASRRCSDLLAQPGVVAVGECGLDYYRNFSPREAQIKAFRAQLELAVRLRKPVFLHQRDAHGDFITILREFRTAPHGGGRALLHRTCERTGRLPGAGLSHRHHGLDLR